MDSWQVFYLILDVIDIEDLERDIAAFIFNAGGGITWSDIMKWPRDRRERMMRHCIDDLKKKAAASKGR